MWHWLFNGRILACHAGGPGFYYRLVQFFLFILLTLINLSGPGIFLGVCAREGGFPAAHNSQTIQHFRMTSDVKRYTEAIDSLKLKQVVTRATRTTLCGKLTLIDYLITNLPSRVTHTDVIPCSLISNLDAPFVTVNTGVTRYVPRYKYIRNEKQFCETAFTDQGLHCTQVSRCQYSLEDPNEQVIALNSLICECLDSHAPSKSTRLARPPAPWLNDASICALQERRNLHRHLAHKPPNNKGA